MSLLQNWYFCLSESTLDRKDHDWISMAIVAVRSCKKHTSLIPNLIYAGKPGPFTELMESEGVNIIYHTTALYDSLYNRYVKFSNKPDVLSISEGAFLRFDIPVLCQDRFALYTDVDVIFNKQFDTNENILNNIKNFMAAPQSNPDDFENDLNSGILVLNIEHMRNNYFKLIDFTRKDLSVITDMVNLDQEILRMFFPLSERSQLNALYNWKPYWGYNERASIIHFHGPKALAVKTRIDTDIPFSYESWETLYNKNKDSYVEYVKLFEYYLKGDTNDAI